MESRGLLVFFNAEIRLISSSITECFLSMQVCFSKHIKEMFEIDLCVTPAVWRTKRRQTSFGFIKCIVQSSKSDTADQTNFEVSTLFEVDMHVEMVFFEILCRSDVCVSCVLIVFCHLWIWSSEPRRLLQAERHWTGSRGALQCSHTSCYCPAVPNSRMHTLHLGRC